MITDTSIKDNQLMTTIAVGENIKDPLSRFAESWSRNETVSFIVPGYIHFLFLPFFFFFFLPFFLPREIPPLAWSYVFLRRLKSKPRSTINIFPLSFPETSRHFFPPLRFHIFLLPFLFFFLPPLPHYSFFFFFKSQRIDHGNYLQKDRNSSSISVILKRVRVYIYMCCQGHYSEQLFPHTCYHRSVLVSQICLQTTFVEFTL